MHINALNQQYGNRYRVLLAAGFVSPVFFAVLAKFLEAAYFTTQLGLSAVQHPRRLFKYRAFSNLSLEALVCDKLYFASPATFNDPLDCQPRVQPNLSIPALQALLTKLIERRKSAELTHAAETLKYRGPKTAERIRHKSAASALQIIADIAWEAGNPDYEWDDPHTYLLTAAIERELRSQFDRGVVSLATDELCPLMWSHYGAQHNGICIGYAVPDHFKGNLRPVTYTGGRVILTSDIEAMIEGNEEAKQRVDEVSVFRKAEPWSYEKEWRLIDQVGLRSSPLELKEVIFGCRCSRAVIWAIVAALEGRAKPVEFFEIRQSYDDYALRKEPVVLGELTSTYPMCTSAVKEMFEGLSNDEFNAAD